MGESDRSLQHLAFFEALAGMAEADHEWKSLSAGLVTLRLFDKWIGGSGLDAWSLTAVRESILAIDTYGKARSLLSSVVDAMENCRRPSITTVAPRLMAYARGLQFDAKSALAADVYRTVLAHASSVDDGDLIIGANLQLGACLRVQAEWKEALAAFSMAATVAAMRGDIMSALKARVAEARVIIDRGNFPEAERLLVDAAADAESHGLPELHASIIADRAHLAHRQGAYEKAVQLGHRALSGLKDEILRDRALFDLAGSFLQLGIRSAARDAYVIISATAVEQYARWAAQVNLVELAFLDGSEPIFEQQRRELASLELPPILAASYHFAVGQGYRIFHKPELARIALQRAIDCAERHQLFELLINAERSLQEITDGGVIIVAEASDPGESVDEAVNAVRELRELAGV